MAMLLMATLLWGGCLSCAQYFMFPGGSAKHCCEPSGECKETKQRSAPQECILQPFDLQHVQISPDHASILAASVSPAVLPSVFAISSDSYLSSQVEQRALDHRPPPDLQLLHSVFRI